MGHFNNRGGNQQRGRGPQGGSARLPAAFDKGEIVDLVFSMVPDRDSGEPFVGAILTDRTIVVPGSYGEYRFNPVLGEKAYLCSLMGGRGKCSALPVHYRELTRNEWVHEPPQRTSLLEDLVFEWSDERHTNRASRLMSHSKDGRVVLVERGYEDKVSVGVVTRVSLIEPQNAGNVLFAIPLAAPAAKPVQPQGDARPLPPPEQPADTLRVKVRSFERKPGILVVRSLDDVKIVDREVSIYEVLSDAKLGVRTTPDTDVMTLKANANQIVRAHRASLQRSVPKIVRENVLARIDAMDVAVPRALAALGVQDTKSDHVVRAEAGDAEPIRRNKHSGGGHAQPASGKQIVHVARPQGTATIGDAVGDALSKKGIKNVPPASSPPPVVLAPEEGAPRAVDPFDTADVAATADPCDSGDDARLVGLTGANDEVLASEAPAGALDEFESRYAEMARELPGKVTVDEVRAAIAKSDLSIVDFSEKPRNIKMFFVRQVRAEKSA